jgi:hypothetical protein
MRGERPPVLIRWIARPDACDDCKAIAAGSPYEQLPTWPGLGDTRCATGCRCAVEGTRAGNVMATAAAFGGAVPPPQQPARARAPEPAVVASASAWAESAPAREPSDAAPPGIGTLAKIPAFRFAPLDRRWTLALGALIFIAVIVAMFAPR